MMKMLMPGGVITMLAFVGPVKAEEPRAVIERAVKAAGGWTEPASLPAVRVKLKAKLAIFGPDTAVSGVVYFQGATAVRGDLVFKTDGANKELIAFGVDGDQAWTSFHGQLQEMKGSDLQNARMATRFVSPGLLQCLLADKGFKDVALSSLPDGYTAKRPTHGVKAAFPDKMEVHLFFDEETGLLVQKALKLPEGPGLDTPMVLSDYREVGAPADERKLQAAGIRPTGAAVLAFLRKQVPEPAKVARVPALIKQLGDEAFEIREKASQELAALGRPAIAGLERALQSTDAEVARRSRDCLALIGRQNGRETLAAAVRQVVWARIDGGAEALLQLLPTADAAAVSDIKEALTALIEHTDKPNAALVKALQDKEPVIRAAAVAVLGKDGGVYRSQPGRRVFPRGLKQPMAFKIEPFLDGEIVEIEFFNRIDPKLFAKP